jgi:hydrogenase-4 component B
MSGVLIKMGIYGLVRLTSLFAHPPLWWGALLLALGVTSGILGVAFAIAQHDIKRLLAYHSVENIGIIVMGLGVAVLGRSLGRSDLVVLGVAGSLLHVYNHGLFKALLFLSAGAIVHTAHTRDLDELGGLSKRMPRTAFFFLFGAIAICGLPPLNGFVSELLIYLGLFRLLSTTGGHVWLAGALAAPALALIGALALACFVKAFGAAFLGSARSKHVEHAHDGNARMNVPMAILVTACAAIGIVPFLLVPLLDVVTRSWNAPAATPLLSVSTVAPLASVSFAAALLMLSIGVCTAGARLQGAKVPPSFGLTWDCGYAAPGPTMQYSSSSFAQMSTGLFGWALWPKVHRPSLNGMFPDPAGFESHAPDLILDRLVLPLFHQVSRLLSWRRWVQQGSIHAYILYIVATLIVLQFWR